MMEEKQKVNETVEEIFEDEPMGEVVEEIKEEIKEEAAKEDVKEVVIKDMEEIVSVTDESNAEDIMAQIESSTADLDVKAETLCRWAAARAGVIVIAPLLGTMALMANEVYLVSRIAKVYDKKLSDAAIGGFLGAIGGAVAGNLLATLIPISIVQVPIAVGITYAVGKVSQAWIKDDMPKDMTPYVAMLQEWKEKATAEAKVLAENPLKNVPLGDESKEQLKNTGLKLKDLMVDMKEKVGEALETNKAKAQETAQVLKEKAQATAYGVAEIIEETAGNAKERIAKKQQAKEAFREEAEEAVKDVPDEVTEELSEPDIAISKETEEK